CPHGFAATVLLTTDSPFTAQAATPGELPSPSERPRRARSRRRVARAVSSATYGPGVSRETWNGVGLSPVSVVGPCEQATPPHTPWVGGKNRGVLLRGGSLGEPPGASALLGAWHTGRGRTVTPPALSLPGPFVTARYRTTLATYLSCESSSKEFWTGTAPPR